LCVDVNFYTQKELLSLKHIETQKTT